jgi:hypothetical protein
MWTLVDDVNDTIHVRASLNVNTQQDEIRNLIAALEKRLTKENPHGLAAVRSATAAGNLGTLPKTSA